jgi:CubicO group peptidase (beta-lactamase class C family)
VAGRRRLSIGRPDESHARRRRRQGELNVALVRVEGVHYTAMADSPAIVDGHCDQSIEPVRDALAEALVSGFEVGAALAVCVDGRAVVDLWGGYADAARTRRWQRDTIVNLYSVGKAISAVCALRLVDAGLLDLDAPVARYWPEFAQASKEHVPVRYLLTHQAGLPAIARLHRPGGGAGGRRSPRHLPLRSPGGSRAPATATTSTRRGS